MITERELLAFTNELEPEDEWKRRYLFQMYKLSEAISRKSLRKFEAKSIEEARIIRANVLREIRHDYEGLLRLDIPSGLDYKLPLRYQSKRYQVK